MNTKNQARSLLILSSLLCAIPPASAGADTPAPDLASYVNPRQGSNNAGRDFSTGNTYPATAVPWGMNFWTPQTGKMGDGWQYSWDAPAICGFKQTHQPSPWINDFGCFSIMPVAGDDIKFPEKQRASRFSHDREISQPHYYAVDLETYNIRAEMTPSSRGAAMRFTYPKDKPASMIIDCYNKGGYIKIIPAENKIVGCSRFYAPGSNAKMPENFATYFVITADHPIAAFGTWNNGRRDDKTAEARGKQVGAYVTFGATAGGKPVEIKIASSFISIEQAQLNLDREIGPKTFDEVKAAAAEAWNSQLRRIAIKGATEEQLRAFYSAVYRTMLFPHAFHEIDAKGATVHYSPFSGTVQPGPMYTSSGFWDTYRAVHPWFTIMFPDHNAGIMRGLVNYYREGGWLPEWSSPGYLDCMIGQNSASVVADAYLKKLISDDDAKILWDALVKGAGNQGPNATGRAGADLYNKLGYVPNDAGIKESVSRTIEYAYDDYCIWRMGVAMGRPASETDAYRQRAGNWANVFDRSINFVRPKDSKGEWESPATWRPDTWGGSFTEGSSWHWTWGVLHDPRGLADAMGGDAAFVKKLDSVFTAHPTFDERGYGHVIHEMTEMVAGGMGQYAHGNEPIHNMIYLYNYAGAPWKTQYHARQVMDRLYSSGWEDGKGLAGDEDTGQMSAWYVMSALGFYPACPGSLEYVIGSPLFGEATLDLGGGRKFTVRAINNSPRNVYIQSAKLNGRPFGRGYIRHDEIMAGGELEFVMGGEPNKSWASSPEARPASMTAEK